MGQREAVALHGAMRVLRRALLSMLSVLGALLLWLGGTTADGETDAMKGLSEPRSDTPLHVENTPVPVRHTLAPTTTRRSLAGCPQPWHCIAPRAAA